MNEYSPRQHPHSPTLDEIAQRAREIWNVSGNAFGQATSCWVEAKRQLSADLSWSHSRILTDPASSPPRRAGRESIASTGRAPALEQWENEGGEIFPAK